MLTTAGAILPIFLLIVVGYLFKRTGFIGDGFWAPAEKLVYYVLLPALIIRSITQSDLSALPIGPMAIALLSTSTCMLVLALLLKPVLRIDGPGFTSLLQGATRVNAYLCFAIGDALYGQASVALCAYCLAVMMPFTNIALVTLMSAYAGTGKPNWARVPLQIIQNPIIIGCAIGWFVNTLAVPVPDWLMASMSILDRGTLPLALLCIGAGLILMMDRTQVVAMSASVVLKLAVMPVIAIVMCQYFSVTGLPMAIAVLFAGAPASTSSYILARQMGGNAPLMAAILSVQTILAAITLPPILAYVAP
jgi:malonate transporter and related proteins